jgi:hypothetical protein
MRNARNPKVAIHLSRPRPNLVETVRCEPNLNCRSRAVIDGFLEGSLVAHLCAKCFLNPAVRGKLDSRPIWRSLYDERRCPGDDGT